MDHYNWAEALAGCRLNRVTALEVIDSTNTECKRRAAGGESEGLVVLAGEQTGGRGRAGREFQSPKGCGLYLSLLLICFNLFGNGLRDAFNPSTRGGED